MKYGLALPVGGVCGDPRVLAGLAALAEESGWDGVFIEDYIVYQGKEDLPTCDPWVALAAMAMRTGHIYLGTTITPLSRRRPWKVAKETVTLDYLSNGRLVLGVGLGDVGDQGFSRVGEVTDTPQRGEMLDEALEILVGLWSGQPFHYQGKYYRVDGLAVLPQPLQKPRIPIWVGGAYPHRKALERAARWDGACFYHQPGPDGWQDMTPADVREMIAFIQNMRTVSTPYDLMLGGRERRDPEQDRALIRSLAEAGATWYSEWVPPADLEMMQAAIRRGPLKIG